MIKIITDTASDLNFEKMEQLGVKVLPYTVSFGNKEYADRVPKDDLEVMDIKMFYKEMETNKEFPKTAQVTKEQFLKAYKEIMEEDPSNEIIVITLAQTLSGTYEAAQLAKDESGFENISVIDSMSGTIVEGMLVYDALELIDNGKSRKEIEELLINKSKRDDHVFYVDGLEHLRRGGRVSSLQSIIGGVLQVKPLLCLGKDGKITSFDKGKGEKIALKKLLKYAVENRRLDNRLMIAHTNCLEKAMAIKVLLEEALGEKVKEILCAGGVVGVHAGAGAILISY